MAMAGGETVRACGALMRATRKSFAGDTVILMESFKQIRNKFEENHPVTSGTEIQRLQQRNSEIAAGVSPSQEHAGARLEIPSEEILRKSAQEGKD